MREILTMTSKIGTEQRKLYFWLDVDITLDVDINLVHWFIFMLIFPYITFSFFQMLYWFFVTVHIIIKQPNPIHLPIPLYPPSALHSHPSNK